MTLPRYPAYKDSGVEWLGKVPEHWTAAKLKWYASVFSGSDQKSDTGVVPLYGANGTIGEAEVASYTHSQTLIGRVGSAGSVNYAIDAYAVSDNALIVQNLQSVSSRFIYYWACLQDFSSEISTTAQPLLTASKVKDRRLTLPPQFEQISIAAFLDHETSKIDTLIAEGEHAVKLLQERRSALISAAVTGKIDVRGLVPREAA